MKNPNLILEEARAKLGLEMTLSEKIEEQFFLILLNLTYHHDDIGLKVTPFGATIDISVIVNKDDHGKIIGKRGQHHLAMQTILRCICAKYGVKCRFIISEPVIGVKQEETMRVLDSRYDPDPLRVILKGILSLSFHGEVSIDTLIRKEQCSATMELRAVKEEQEKLELMIPAFNDIWMAMGNRNGYKVNITLADAAAPDASKIKV